MLKCGSGVTAEEKFKKIRSDGSVRRYVYYYCNRFKDYHCKEAYIREETLIAELLKIIDKVNLDEVGTLNKMKQEVGRYKKFNALISKVNS